MQLAMSAMVLESMALNAFLKRLGSPLLRLPKWAVLFWKCLRTSQQSSSIMSQSRILLAWETVFLAGGETPRMVAS